MLLPSREPSSSYSLLKFVYVTSQLRHSLAVHPLLRKILDPPLGVACWDLDEAGCPVLGPMLGTLTTQSHHALHV